MGKKSPEAPTSSKVPLLSLSPFFAVSQINRIKSGFPHRKAKEKKKTKMGK